MDILYFQWVRPFGLGGEPSWTSFTSKGCDPLGWGGTIMDILYFQGVRPFRLGGEPSWTSFTSKGYDPLGWVREEGTIMDILYFQGVRPFRLGGEQSWTSFTSKGLQVLHLPRKTSQRGSKCCACDANRSGAQCNQSLPDFRGPL